MDIFRKSPNIDWLSIGESSHIMYLNEKDQNVLLAKFYLFIEAQPHHSCGSVDLFFHSKDVESYILYERARYLVSSEMTGTHSGDVLWLIDD